MLAAVDPKTGKPLVDLILDKAGQKGTGNWSVIAAQQLGVPATAIEARRRGPLDLVAQGRARSGREGLRQCRATISARQGRDLLDDLEKALLAGKIVAYAQGFAVMAEASKEFNWNLPLPTIAKIWRAGCIIRSHFLDQMTAAFTKAPDAANLMVAPDFCRS